jgi:hypothetical protein
VTAIESAAWFVGGAMKFIIEKEIVVPGERVPEDTLLTVTTAKEVDPVH